MLTVDEFKEIRGKCLGLVGRFGRTNTLDYADLVACISELKDKWLMTGFNYGLDAVEEFRDRETAMEDFLQRKEVI